MKKTIVPGLLSGLAMLIVSFIFSMLLSLIFPGLTQKYENYSLFRPWNDPLMYLFFLSPFILGIVLAYIWNKVRTAFSGTDMQKSFSFGMVYFLLTIPGMLITYSSFQVSKWMVLSWLGSIFIQAIAGVFVLVKMTKDKSES